MNAFHKICRWVRSLSQRRAVKHEIDEELRFHVEQRTTDNVAVKIFFFDFAERVLIVKVFGFYFVNQFGQCRTRLTASNDLLPLSVTVHFRQKKWQILR